MWMQYDCYISLSSTQSVFFFLEKNGFLSFQNKLLQCSYVITFSIFSDSAQEKQYVVAVPAFKIYAFYLCHGACHS